MCALGVWFKALRQFHPTLPKDPRPLLHTPRHCCVRAKAGGRIVHMGLRAGLIQILGDSRDHILYVKIQLNIDRLKLYNSSWTQLWPILCRVIEPFVSHLFVVGIYCGLSKPNDADEYFSTVVGELEEHLRTGISGLQTTRVILSNIVCDTPARSFVRQVKSHTGYFGCGHCMQKVFIGRCI